jgi:hypothetical protein
MIKIAFQTPQLDVRGTCVALYDYALYNETLLGNKSVIVVEKNNKSEILAIHKFTNRFPVYFYENKEDLHDFLRSQKCDIFYAIKYGKNDGLFFDDVKTVIHCVFDLSEPHGNIYAAVSETLAKKYNYPLYVPHMIGLTPSLTGENMRKELNIPVNAMVFGRHGGMDTFNIGFCMEVISELVQLRNDIYFVFVNTPIFIEHPQVIFLEPIVDTDSKNRFIQTCDAHLECGTLGHSFGLSMGEFSVNNKPIIAYKGPVWNTAHYDILKDKALYFRNKEEFKQILSSFNPQEYVGKDLNCYKEFSPEKVMKIFSDVFIHEKVKKNAI